jgi:N6-adenosine-specific RNA methylase IME4
MGTGDWLRGQTEHCVLAVLGDRVFLNGSHTPVIHAGRKEHWQKPEDYYVLVEETYP